MLEILPMPGAVAGFQVSGSLTAKDYERLIAELESKLAGHPRIAIYADLTELASISPGALVKDLRYALSKLRELARFWRAAVVSDSVALRGAIGLFASLWPEIELRSFPGAARAQAQGWVCAPDRDQRRGALRWLKTTRPDTYAFVCDGVVTVEDVDLVLASLKRELEERIAVRILARIEHLGGVQPQALFKSVLMRFKALGVRKIERYAIVGGPAWLDRYAALLRRLADLDIRRFSLDQEKQAWAWLEAEPVERDAAQSADAGSAASSRFAS